VGFGRGKGFSPIPGIKKEQTIIIATSSETGILVRTHDTTWDASHDADNAETGYEDGIILEIRSCVVYTTDFWITRGRFRFDTSVLAGEIIDKVIFSIKFHELVAHIGTSYICLVSGEGLGDNMALSDYGVIRDNTTLIAPQVNSLDFVVGEFRDFELDPDFHKLINKTGYTTLCLRTSFDREDDPVIRGVKGLIAGFYFSYHGEPKDDYARLIIDHHAYEY